MLLQRITITLTIVCLYLESLGGVAKYAAISVGVPFATTLPPVLLALSCLFLFVLKIPRNPLVAFSAAIVFALQFNYILLQGYPLPAALVGFYLILPLIAGLLTSEDFASILRQHALPLCLLSVIGVLINVSVPFPWVELSYDAQGLDVVREVSSLRVAAFTSRIGGFSRDNFTAANYICVFFIVYFVRCKRPQGWILDMVLAVLAVAALFFTTSKMALITTVLAIVYILAMVLIRLFSNNILPWLAGIPARLSFALCVLGPIFGMINGYDYSVLNYNDKLFTLSTISVRIYQTWPLALEMIFADGNPLAPIIGRGLVGIGSAQKFFEPAYYNPADNVAIYLYVKFGIIGLVLFVMAFQRTMEIGRSTGFRGAAWAAGLMLLMLGMTNGLLDSFLFSFILGGLLGQPRRHAYTWARSNAGRQHSVVRCSN